jgi:RNA polymerase sigma-70 factor (ECF subfamily)
MSPSSPQDLSTEELFRRFAPFVARFLYRLGVSADGLDDLVQEVFLVVHRRGGYKAGPAKPTSYLATIAANAASVYRRRRRVEQARSSDTEVEGLVSANKGPVQVLEVSERLQLLQAVLDRLEPDFRTTLILADIEGESCASIAASSGVPTGTIYWRLHEARKRFRRALRAEMAGVPARSVRPGGDDQVASGSRERGSVLAFAASPLWFLTDARRLLRAGAAQAPVHYEVPLGLEKHRHLASGTNAVANGTNASSGVSALSPASLPAHTSAGIGMLGAGGGGIAAIAVIAAAFYLHAPPRPSETERPAQPIVVSDTARTPPAGTSSSQPASVSTPRDALPRAAAEPSSETARDSENVAPMREPSAKDAPSSASRRSNAAGTHAAAPRSSAASTSSNETASEAAPMATPSSAPPTVNAPQTVSSDTKVEAREIARAERILSSDPAGALAIVRQARTRFTPSFLPEERDYIEVMALRALGRSDEARRAATRFLNAYPAGAFSTRVRRVMGR